MRTDTWALARYFSTTCCQPTSQRVHARFQSIPSEGCALDRGVDKKIVVCVPECMNWSIDRVIRPTFRAAQERRRAEERIDRLRLALLHARIPGIPLVGRVQAPRTRKKSWCLPTLDLHTFDHPDTDGTVESRPAVPSKPAAAAHGGHRVRLLHDFRPPHTHTPAAQPRDGGGGGGARSVSVHALSVRLDEAFGSACAFTTSLTVN